MDAQLARTLRVGDQVIYRNAIHTIIVIAKITMSGEPAVFLDGVYAPKHDVPPAQLYLPALLNPDAGEGSTCPTPS